MWIWMMICTFLKVKLYLNMVMIVFCQYYLLSVEREKSVHIWEYYGISESVQRKISYLGSWNLDAGFQLMDTPKWIRRVDLEVRDFKFILDNGSTMYYRITFLGIFDPPPKLYVPSTLNIDLILWHTLWLCAAKWITHDLIHDFHFTFQDYTLPHTLNCICVSLFKFHTWILKQF